MSLRESLSSLLKRPQQDESADDALVYESSLESFPASDPPGWVSGRDIQLQPSMRKRIVIIGGGFAGLAVAKKLWQIDADITLIDRNNFHLFQPLLYQVATGGLSPANISVPLRAELKHFSNITVLLGEVIAIDVGCRAISLREGKTCGYDYLVVAAGAGHNYYSHPEWQRDAPGLKSIEEAVQIRSRILSLFESAELETVPSKRKRLLRFVIIGGGPTGVELAGAVGEIAHQTLKGNFRRIDPASTEIIVIEAASSILAGYDQKLVERAKDALAGLGVTVRENVRIRDISKEHLVVEWGGQIETIESRCILWAAGVRASPVGEMVAKQVGAVVDNQGRVEVEADLSLRGHPNIFVIGDIAKIRQRDGTIVQAVAPAAMQAGRYVAKILKERIAGSKSKLEPFEYRNRGAMATVGGSFAIVQLRHFAFAGLVAWFVWLWVHIFYLTQFTNRLLVVIQWGWSYFTFNRSALLITGSKVE